MSLMRGPHIEEPVEEVKEEERSGPLRVLPALPPTPDETNTQLQAFGLDITKEDNGQYKMAPHESPNSSPQTSMEGEGESSPDEGAEPHTATEGEPGSEPPISLSDLLG